MRKKKGDKFNHFIMKRRKITGLILIISTFIYFIACLLALYQNQRVKMEKGIEEALQAYSSQESLNIKELSKDFNLRLDEKLDEKEGKQQILKFEGSFERMEKNITNVTDEMALVEYNIINLNDRLEQIENFYDELYVELTSKYDLYEEHFNEINNNTQEIYSKIDEIEIQLSAIEKQIIENDMKQNQDKEALQTQLDEVRIRLVELISNALLYRYDEDTQTLYMYGDEGSDENE